MNEDASHSSLTDLRVLDLKCLLSPGIATASKTALDRIIESGTGECNNYFNQCIGHY